MVFDLLPEIVQVPERDAWDPQQREDCQRVAEIRGARSEAKFLRVCRPALRRK